MNKIKNRIIIILTVVSVFAATCGLIKIISLKDINKTQIKVNDFIEYVDEVSDNRVQVNWKYVCALIGVLKDNNFKEIGKEEIINIASMFIDEENKLKSIDDVMGNLKLSEREVKRVYEYIDELYYFGVTPSKLKEDTKYIKFINSVKEGAIKSYKNYGILPSVTIAQAILETGWGESELASKYNNLFGIKADSSWSGESVKLETKEYFDTMINDRFRVYKDKNQSIYDHGKFLYENNRYKSYGLFEAKTYIYQARALQDAGYSTHMDEKGEKIYANQLIQIIRQYNLQVIDSEVQYNIQISKTN